MGVILKKVRQNMRSAKPDNATPLPVNKSTMDSLAKEIKITKGLKGIRRIFLPKNKALFFGAQAESASSQERYAVKIKFTDWDGVFQKEASPKLLKAETISGKEIWVTKPNINKNLCQFSCTCPDFRFNWEYPAFKTRNLVAKGFQQSLGALTKQAGSYQNYDRETPPLSRPAKPKNPNPIGRDFKNPDNVLGMCKHVYRLAQILTEAGFVGGKY